MRFYVVDAFTGDAFAGNPAGVVVLDGPADPGWMQRVAAEMKHSETAFVLPSGDTTGLRWFTPATEVDLCGHATVAATQVLGGEQTYDTRSGLLRCTKHADGWIELDFPADEPRATQDDVSRILPGYTPSYVGRARENLFVELGTAEEVRRAEPDLDALRDTWTGRLVVTAKGSGTDFVSRFFGPGVGVDEDPVTGSAHCCLAPYWSRKLGRTALVGAQVSARGGVVATTVDGDRVRLRGQAVTVVSGELHV
ncbi:PhzF family phenazine biosynthesis protein [Amycolatopsis jiangsuensis]|uniref:Putative PhzF superfamily epimerase YddE/YHI9 n=1 Tax=Amycolatopsis jiangsuensis TaxID=1181879 RepID=A0A840J3K3_9PSEU|nr:PhzF family phenazine biosynthesis protein [Amycolatopsis jiangsuensis]MBB4687992.1 putative PhzF superfamily epimerase YddE/YHI9 [Amycolatopsis jiangsuensis]